jgi:hypothetical protein
MDEAVLKSRPSIVPLGKFGGVPIVMLGLEDLCYVRREFSCADLEMGISREVARDVQGAVMSELSRRQRVAARRRGRWLAAQAIKRARQRA